jgi:ribosome recycling factor
MTEEARVAVRSARRDGNEMLKDAEKEKEISEDESKLGQKKIQELTDQWIARVDEVGAAKEKEVMEV